MAYSVGGYESGQDNALIVREEIPYSIGGKLPSSPRGGGVADIVELRELRYFAAAARSGNLARAARDLNVTASAVSQRLRRLEDELGTPLLVRHGRGVITTQAGFCLLERVDAVVRLLNAPLGPEDPRASPGGSLALAVPAELAGVLLMPMLAAVREQFPGVTPILKESVEGGIDSWLLAGQVDVAILPDPSEPEELHIEPVLSERIGIVAAPRSSLADSVHPMRLRELECLPLILPGKRHWIRRRMARVAFQRGLRCEPTFEVDGLVAIKEMVRQGLGCAVLPASAVREETARGALVFRPFEQPVLAATYAVACMQKAPLLVRRVAQAIHEVICSSAAGGAWPGVRPVRAPAPASCPGPRQSEQVWASPSMNTGHKETALT